MLQDARPDVFPLLIPRQALAADLVHEPNVAGKHRDQTSHRSCWGVPQPGNPAPPCWCGFGRALPMGKRRWFPSEREAGDRHGLLRSVHGRTGSRGRPTAESIGKVISLPKLDAAYSDN